MRIAALYDVHGNLTALEAVLAEVEREEVDLVLVGGDAAAGPQAEATLDRLRGLERARFIRGNSDRELADVRWEAKEPLGRERMGWMRERLGEDRLLFLDALPERLTFPVDGLGEVLFCHGSPRSDLEVLTRATPEERLRDALAGVEAAVVVCGHTHVQFDRSHDGVRVVNAGSVGIPYEDTPGAYWALLGPAVELRRTEYDLEAAAEAFRASGFPDADEFVRETLFAEEGPDEATAFFEKLASEQPEFAGDGA